MQSAGLVQEVTSVANEPRRHRTKAEMEARADEWWRTVGEDRVADDDFTGYLENMTPMPDLSGTIT